LSPNLKVKLYLGFIIHQSYLELLLPSVPTLPATVPAHSHNQEHMGQPDSNRILGHLITSWSPTWAK